MRQTPHPDADEDGNQFPTPEQVKARFDELASYFWKATEELGSLTGFLTREDDQRAAQSIFTDLVWATENCTVIGLHQIGKALDDDMGYGVDETADLDEEPQPRRPARGRRSFR